jgi:hypothetical protein
LGPDSDPKARPPVCGYVCGTAKLNHMWGGCRAPLKSSEGFAFIGEALAEVFASSLILPFICRQCRRAAMAAAGPPHLPLRILDRTWAFSETFQLLSLRVIVFAAIVVARCCVSQSCLAHRICKCGLSWLDCVCAVCFKGSCRALCGLVCVAVVPLGKPLSRAAFAQRCRLYGRDCLSDLTCEEVGLCHRAW